MKRLSVNVLVLIMLLAASVCTLYAQSEGTAFKLPFSFRVGEQLMPQGQYFVRSLYWSAVAIQGPTKKDALITLTQPVQLPADREPKLIFHKYGDSYFLAEARLPNMDLGRKFLITKQEVERAGKVTKQVVEIAAR